MTTENQEWDADFSQATELNRQGQYSDALSILERLAHTADSDAERFAAHVLRAGILGYQLEEWAPAEALFRMCVECRPRSERASVGLFHALLERDEVDLAFGEMRRLLALRPSEEYSRILADMNG